MTSNYEKNTKFIKLMKEKIPVFLIGIQTLISNTLFSKNFLMDSHLFIGNNITFGNHLIENKEVLRNVFWIYFPILCILCGFWEFYHAWHIYKLRHKNFDHKKIKNYSIISTFISVITFIIFSYYINDGRPFVIIFKYNYLYASIVFYVWAIILSVYNFIEHNHYHIMETNRNQAIVPSNDDKEEEMIDNNSTTNQNNNN